MRVDSCKGLGVRTSSHPKRVGRPHRRVTANAATQLLYLTGDHLSSTSLVMDAAGAVLSEQRCTGHRPTPSALEIWLCQTPPFG